MGFAKVKSSTFNELQVEAGLLLSNFDPASPATPADSDIIAATTGGISVSCVYEYSDWGEDVDNCPNNTKELKHVDGCTATFSTTILNMTLDAVKLALGPWTSTAANGGIKPTKDLTDSHFQTLWFLGDRADGGLVLIKLINALSSSGFSLQTTKNNKGQISIEMTGHVSISSPDEYPMEFYVQAGTSSGSSETGLDTLDDGDAADDGVG